MTFDLPYISKRKIVLSIVFLGFIIRVIYLFFGHVQYFGTNIHITGDTQSYTESFINLYKSGNYTFDIANKEAYYGRLPGYPFFYGIHYIIAGEKYSFIATALSQLLLDTVAIFLMGVIAFNITRNNTAQYVTSTLYAFYPFSILWIPIVGTESLSVFLICLWLFLLTKTNGKKSDFVLIGLIIATCFFVREFLGVLLPISLVYIFFKFRKNERHVYWFSRAAILVVAFLSIYIWWPVRNYINHDKIMFVKPVDAGYINLTSDVASYIKWYHCWSNDDNKWIAAAISDKKMVFPENIFSSDAEKVFADSLIEKCRECGSGFYARKFNKKYEGENCNDEITRGFTILKESYKKNFPLSYYTKTPIQNLAKAFFKNSVELDNSGFLMTLSFALRSLLILLGIVFLYKIFSTIEYLPIYLYFLFIYIFICFFHRSLEMRYIIHADVLLLIPAGAFISRVINLIAIRLGNRI